MKMEEHEKMQHYAVADWLQVLSLMGHPHNLVRLDQIELEGSEGG